MKKYLTLLLVAGTTMGLSACGGIPTCNDELDECTQGGPYTEERTVQANRYKTVMPKPAPVAKPAPAPAPAPVAPPPAPVVDTQIMRSAEPEFRQISK